MEGGEAVPHQALAWPQLGRLPAARGMASDILQESVLLRLRRGLQQAATHDPLRSERVWRQATVQGARPWDVSPLAEHQSKLDQLHRLPVGGTRSGRAGRL